MVEEIALKMARFTTPKTLDRVILHTVMHHSSISTYMPNFIEIDKSFVNGRIHKGTFETSFMRSTLKRQPKNESFILSPQFSRSF